MSLDEGNPLVNILMICSLFSLNKPDASGLHNDLAEAYAQQGHFVQVVFLDWSNEYQQTQLVTYAENIRVLVVPALRFKKMGRTIELIFKWGLSAYVATAAIKKYLGKAQFDLVIGCSPAIIINPCMDFVIRHFRCPSFLLLWDFFPLQHQQIGLINNPVIFRIAYFLEQHAIRKYDVIGCHSEQHKQYLMQHYRLRAKQRLEFLPLWAKWSVLPVVNKAALRERYHLPNHQCIAIFGGQLIAGRGIESILAVAKLAREDDNHFLFLIVGGGPFEAQLQQEIASTAAHNVRLMGRLPREEYIELLIACDIGLACLTESLNSPCFPTKTLEYLKLGLPIAASVHQGMSYGDFIQSSGVGLVAHAGNHHDFYANLKKLSDHPELRAQYGQNAKHCFRQYFEVEQVSKQLLAYFFGKEHAVP